MEIQSYKCSSPKGLFYIQDGKLQFKAGANIVEIPASSMDSYHSIGKKRVSLTWTADDQRKNIVLVLAESNTLKVISEIDTMVTEYRQKLEAGIPDAE